MKKILSLLMTLFIGISLFAQVPIITSKVKNLSVSENGLSVAINPSLSDTLKNGDTIFYKVLVNHSFAVYPYLSLIEKQTGTRDTTALLTFWQSVDGTHNWQQVTNTATPTAWAITLAKATATEVDFWRSIGWFNSTYLGVRLIGGGKKTGYTYYNCYYGSIRINKL